MSSKQEWLWERIVQYDSTHTRTETFTHFLDEKVPRSTIYRALKRYADRGTTARKPGSGRPAKIMTKMRKTMLAKNLEGRLDVSTRKLARKYNCTYQHVQKTIKTLGFKNYQRKRAPKYTDEQIPVVKSCARWIHDRFKTESFVLDDEKYFTLTGSQKGSYYARDKANVSDDVKYKQSAKFEKKLLVYLAASDRGVSEPFIAVSGLAINQETYVDECLRGVLLPFLHTHHADGDYIFWPDKASSHYAKSTIDFLKRENVSFVPKERNPTNLPQCRPIEDLWGWLDNCVYANGWKAENLKQLKRRVKFCIKKLDQNSVRRAFLSIRRNLRKVYTDGPFAAVH